MVSVNNIHLPISTDYVQHWGFWEAIREIIQNAVDQGDYFIESLVGVGSIKIKSNNSKLELSTLMLGNSTKRDDSDKIGKYGEGYKLALLVLCRMGIDVAIKNGRDCWNVFIEPHPQLGSDCLAIRITEDVYLEDDDGSVSFMIRGVSEDQFKLIENNFIDLTVAGTHKVIAENNNSYCFKYKRGANKKVFVGGLYVCDLSDDYHYSYNFAPNVLELDRDRQSVSGFYLEYEATKLLTMSGRVDILTTLANEGAKDISDYYAVTPVYGGTTESKHKEEVERFALKGFIEKHGEKAYPIDSAECDDAKRIVTEKCISTGLTPVVVTTALYKMLPSKLKGKISTIKPIGKVSDALSEFLTRNAKHMRSKPKKELLDIIQSLLMTGK